MRNPISFTKMKLLPIVKSELGSALVFMNANKAAETREIVIEMPTALADLCIDKIMGVISEI